MLACNLFLRAFARGVSSLCDEMYLVIYFFVPSHEVYLHDVTNMYLVIYFFMSSGEVYLRGVMNLYFL